MILDSNLGRFALRAAMGLGIALGWAGRAHAQSAPPIVFIVAEGTGFPFEDPSFSKFPALRRLRDNSRPFDAAFANDPAWTKTNETLLGGIRRGNAALAAALKTRGYISSALSGAGGGVAGFDRAVKAVPTEMAARILETMDAARSRPAFVFATLDLRNIAANAPPPPVDAPPLEAPAIALFDRGPLDPVRFPVIPPPREPADRSALAARRSAAFAVLDKEIGTLIAGLEKRGLRSKTVIALVSTGPAPRPERAAPSRPDLLFEDWLRALVLIQAPGLARPGVGASTLALTSDLAPTLAALGGGVLARGEGGVDLSPALRDPKRMTRQTVLSNADRQAPRLGRSVRSQKFRFTQWPDGSEELFDEDKDPREWNNLANDPAMQAQKAELAKRLVPPRAPGPATPARPAAGRRPNVLMIIGDDLTAQYGQFADVKTPNLDRLRARGRVYERAYAPAPFCTPSRAAFLSGLSPARLELQTENAFGEVFTPRIPLIQEQFRASGYYTASVGKVWDSQPGEKRGWDMNEWLPPLLPGQVEAPARLMPNMPVEGGPTTNPDEIEGDGRRARLAAKVLEETRDKPLFLALGLVRPHVAWIAPQKYFDMYPVDKIRFTPAPSNDTADIPVIAIKNRPQALPGLMLAGREPGGFSADPAEARRGIAAYLACVSFMDAQLGLVLDALDRGDRWKDTIVVLFGDNGHHFGDHGGLWRKNTLFEESLRVPMIIATPGMAHPGVSTTALADLIDIYPTLVDLTGIARPGTLDGISLAPTLKDPGASVQDALVQYRPTEPSKTGYSIRTTRFRYTLWPDGSEELYDLSTDPAGRKDLARQPAQAATLATLRKRIEELVR
ncbi:MAG TPA: sulfatase-like hydrolase/transferase [Vicinamibacteria bacterium]|nr:sulfatase-like hydrolase/transferase [Vicinamibacteria bacterium]